MTVKRRSLITALVVALGPVTLTAQEQGEAQDTAPPRYGHFHSGLTIHDYGVSLGNAPRVNGVRLNVQDAELDRVNGINVTLWKPREPLSGTINGLQLGLLPGSEQVNGIALGLGGVVAERQLRWISVGGLGAVSNGSLEGVGIGGLAVVTNGRITGAGIAGLAVVANGAITGLSVAGYRVDSPRVTGVNVAGLYLNTREFSGMSLSAYNRVRGLQRGVTIGIYNSAYVLKGIQVGVLNRAKNNRGIFRILPVLNAHL